MPDEHLTVEECSKIFIVVNFEEDKKSAQSIVNEDKALMRFELLECIVRIASEKFCAAALARGEEPDISDAVERITHSCCTLEFASRQAADGPTRQIQGS